MIQCTSFTVGAPTACSSYTMNGTIEKIATSEYIDSYYETSNTSDTDEYYIDTGNHLSEYDAKTSNLPGFTAQPAPQPEPIPLPMGDSCNSQPDGASCPDDGDSCTDDYCMSGTCEHPRKDCGNITGNIVYFYHTDAAGTPMAMTTKYGDALWRADYKPFGEEQKITGTIKNNKEFVGKEKDEETGLDYFGARYHLDKIGRFVSPDPALIAEKDLLNPQRLNRYAYSLNNPYRYVDPDGKWPEEVHNKIINEAFQGSPWLKLSDRALIMFRQASAYVDTFQDPEYSYLHAMRKEGQSVEKATQLMNDYIGRRVADYKRLMAEGKTDEAYIALGMAMHPIMDSTSPAHEGMQEWRSPWTHPIEGMQHVRRETSEIFNANPEYMKKSVDLLRKFYYESNK